MPNQPPIRPTQNLPLPPPTPIKRHLLTIPPYPTHPRTVLSFESSFYGGETTESGCDAAEDACGGVVVEEEEEGAA